MVYNDKRDRLPDVSFIIPCYQCRRTLGFALQAIFNQKTKLHFEIIVVDSSPTSVAEWISTKFRGLKVIRSNERLLPGAARNLGAERSRGEFLAFVDADAVVDTDWLEQTASRLESDSRTCLVGGWVRNANPDSVASRIQYWIEFAEFLPGLESGVRRFISSSNFLIRRLDFQNVGGFDANLAMAEDLQFAARLKGDLYFTSATGISHFHRTRWKLVTEHLTRLGYWSGKLRGDIELPGSWLRRIPAFSILLPPYRSLLILRRAWGSGHREAFRVLLHFPLLLTGLSHWAAGFYRGLRERTKDEGRSSK